MHTVLVEKILRVQPDANKIYLLVRGTNESSAKQRVQQEVVTSLSCFYSTVPVKALSPLKKFLSIPSNRRIF